MITDIRHNEQINTADTAEDLSFGLAGAETRTAGAEQICVGRFDRRIRIQIVLTHIDNILVDTLPHLLKTVKNNQFQRRHRHAAADPFILSHSISSCTSQCSMIYLILARCLWYRRT